jgi:hypothetical protein
MEPTNGIAGLLWVHDADIRRPAGGSRVPIDDSANSPGGSPAWCADWRRCRPVWTVLSMDAGGGPHGERQSVV